MAFFSTADLLSLEEKKKIRLKPNAKHDVMTELHRIQTPENVNTLILKATISNFTSIGKVSVYYELHQSPASNYSLVATSTR